MKLMDLVMLIDHKTQNERPGMTLSLRPYQQRALNDLLDWFADGNAGNPILDACVGSGKSVMLAWLCQHAIESHSSTRIIMLVPTKELLEQNLEKMLAIWPDAPVGIMSAAAGKKQLGYQITIATIGTIYKRAHEVGNVDLVIIDECHGIPGGDAGMYRKFFAGLQQYCPHVRFVGATGTPFRGNGEWLTVVDQPLFHDIATRVTMDELLELKFLSPLTTRPTSTHIDASSVKMIGGDYAVSELAKVADRPELVDAACKEAIQLAADRQKWLVYCVTIEHAQHVTDALNSMGVKSAIVTGDTPKSDRKDIINAFRRGEYRALVSVAVLTTGFDVPDVDCIVLLRTTRSPVLYVQILGRGLRVADHKTDCLVLDFTDTIETLGPVNKIKGRNKKKKREAEAPVKVCDECGSLNPIQAKECKTCGMEFPAEEVAPHRTQASEAQVLQLTKPTITNYGVTRMTWQRHQKAGSPDSLRIDYWSGIKAVAKEWICLEHGVGYARDKAHQWWWKRTGLAAPQTVEQAIRYLNESGLKYPASIDVNVSSKYPEITKINEREEAA